MGIFKLYQVKDNADDWILMIDESIEFGHDKLLLILGVREANLDFKRPLNYQDMICMRLIASGSWKGEDIEKVLEELSSEIGTIKYAVADNGNSIMKALRLRDLTHVQDINHKISWFIKELYKEDESFKSYCKELAKLRGGLGLSRFSHILPPQQRVNSRFMNLKPILRWGMAVLKLLDFETSNPEEKEKMQHIKQYESLIKQTFELVEIANHIQEILKNRGLSEKTKKECLCFFDKVTDERILKFKAMVQDYMIKTLQSVKENDVILCSSDILESSFGKYKNYISENTSVGITNLSLSIPAFCSKLKKEEITNAMENIKVNQIKEWSAMNIGQTQTEKRRSSLKMERRKKFEKVDF